MLIGLLCVKCLCFLFIIDQANGPQWLQTWYLSHKLLATDVHLTDSLK